MANLLGRPQDLLVGVSETLWYRPTLDGDVVTIADSPAPTITVTDPDGSSVAITETPAKSGTDKLYLTRTWVAATTPTNYLKPYKAVWSFAVGSTTYNQVQYFFLLGNLFISQVVEADITNLDPVIQNQAGQGSGSLATWIREAWGDIWDMVWSMTHMHPSRWPSDRFRNAHIEQAKFRIYEYTLTRQPNDAALGAAMRHEARAKKMVREIVSNPKIVVLGADADVSQNRERIPGFF